MLKFIRITPKDIDICKSFKLRKEDKAELLAATGLKNPKAAVKRCIRQSTEWTEATIDLDTGELVMLHGLASYQDVGIPWMIASPVMYRHRKVLLRYSHKAISEMFTKFSVLANYVDARNEAHIVWLKRMGFKFDDKQDTVMNGFKFLYFYKFKEEK